jgi:hypothetical protein
MEDKAFICQCKEDILYVGKDYPITPEFVNLSIFSFGHFRSKPNLWQRLKFCWFHIKTGEIYKDDIILSSEQAKELGEWLINNK